MKKSMFFGVILSAVAFSQVVTGVAAASPTPFRQEIRELRQERRDTILENMADRVEKRFSRHQERLNNLIERFSKHIQEREAKGKDMSNAKKALETAKASLANAVTLGDDAVAKLRAVQPEAWKDQKTDAKAAREAVKKAQVAYAQVVKDLHQVLKELKNTK